MEQEAVTKEEQAAAKMSPWERLGIDPWEVRPGNWQQRLNLGAGDRVWPTWTNHDRERHSERIDVAWDLNETPWAAFPPNHFSRVDAWAVLEHIRPTLLESMNEIWRVLRPGGKVHIKVPRWNYYKAYRDPTHIWRGWDLGVFTFFDARMTHGRTHSYYTPYKWELLDCGYTDKKHVAIWARLRKVCSLAQWEEIMNGVAEAAVQKQVIWINGRAGAGKSTLCRYLQSLYPTLVIVDDHTLWKDVFRYVYLKTSGEQTATLGADLFKDERPESMHRDFAVECALVAKSLARQGHRVIVDMIASPQARRDRIEQIIKPYWVYVKREAGEVRKPQFDKMKKYDLLVDNDKLDKHQMAAYVAKKLCEGGMLP